MSLIWQRHQFSERKFNISLIANDQNLLLIWKTQMGRQDCQRNQRCYKCQPSHCGEFHIRQLQTPIKFALFKSCLWLPTDFQNINGNISIHPIQIERYIHLVVVEEEVHISSLGHLGQFFWQGCQSDIPSSQ